MINIVCVSVFCLKNGLLLYLGRKGTDTGWGETKPSLPIKTFKKTWFLCINNRCAQGKDLQVAIWLSKRPLKVSYLSLPGPSLLFASTCRHLSSPNYFCRIPDLFLFESWCWDSPWEEEAYSEWTVSTSPHAGLASHLEQVCCSPARLPSTWATTFHQARELLGTQNMKRVKNQGSSRRLSRFSGGEVGVACICSFSLWSWKAGVNLGRGIPSQKHFSCRSGLQEVLDTWLCPAGAY